MLLVAMPLAPSSFLFLKIRDFDTHRVAREQVWRRMRTSRQEWACFSTCWVSTRKRRKDKAKRRERSRGKGKRKENNHEDKQEKKRGHALLLLPIYPFRVPARPTSSFLPGPSRQVLGKQPPFVCHFCSKLSRPAPEILIYTK